MRRTKPPVLTSPWKIGFFVALVLVFVSIGVAYYVVDHFGLAGTLFDRNWLDKKEWLSLVKGTGFIFDMLPLAGLVAVTSMISYLVITSAVRKYKRYLDSGLDYKNLLSSLKETDLEDKSRIERIKNHPELQRLLLGLSGTLEEKNKALGEREAALDERVAEAVQISERKLTEGFAQECERLKAAIEAGAPELGGIELSSPGLRKLGEFLRPSLQSQERREGSELAESYGDLRKTSDVIHSKLHEIAHEIDSSREGALEIEEQLNQLASHGATGSRRDLMESAREAAGTIVASLRSLEELNASLDLLSEETRGVAISSALHAGSGVGTQDDLVKLAEEVKGVAERFKSSTRRFIEISAALRTSAGALDALAESSPASTAGVSAAEEALANVRSRVSLWVERVVVLSDKISNARESYGVAVSSLPEAELRHIVSRPDMNEPPVDDAVGPLGDGFETLDRGETLFSESKELRGESGEDETGDPGVFEEMTGERLGPLDDMGARDQVTRELDRTGVERDEALGVESTSKRLPPEPDEERVSPIEPERYVVDSRGGERELRVTRPAAPEPPSEAAWPGEVAARSEPRTMEGCEVRGDTSMAKETATCDEDGDVVSLYDLGAVDYDPALHN